MMTPSLPPRLAERLVRVLTGRDRWSDVVEGDLREEYAVIAARSGRLVAHGWYWLQVMALLFETGFDACRSFSHLGDRPLASFRREFVRAIRALARHPLVASTIVVTLALGLGVNAAALQLANAFILNPLPGLRTDGLVMIAESSPAESDGQDSVAPGNFYDWRRDARSVDQLAAYEWWQVNFTSGGDSERAFGFRVAGDFFSMFGVVAEAGRLVSEADETPGATHVVVLSDALWRRQFGSRPDAVGESVRIAGEMYTVVGIAPASFTFPNNADLWAPLPQTDAAAADHRNRSLTVIGHLSRGVTTSSASGELKAIYARSRAAFPHDNDGRDAVVQTLAYAMRDPSSDQIVSMVQLAAILVLLIGGMNIANLLIARGWDRQRETALRLAIGASRGQVLRQFIFEGLAFGVPAVPLALGLAWIFLRAMRAVMPARIERFVPGWIQIGIDGRLALVTLGAAILVAIVVSIVPAWQTSRPALVQALSQGGRTMSAGTRRHRVRRALVIVQLALALPLLVAAALAILAARGLMNAPSGFDPAGVLVLRTQLPDAGFERPDARQRFADRLIARVSGLAGVESAGTITHVPLSGSGTSRRIEVEGLAPIPNQPPPSVVYRVASDRYFDALRIPIIRGRGFTPADRDAALPVAIVSAAMAAEFWPGIDPVGRRVRFAAEPNAPWTTVVGVAGNILDDIDRRDVAMLYVPAAQDPPYAVELAVRTAGDPVSLAADVRRALRDVDPFQPAEITPMTSVIADRMAGFRMIGATMTVLGGLALVLAAVGIYSLMSYSVAQRRHEMGVRIALGATPASVMQLTLRDAATLTLTGLAAGLLLAVPLSRAMASALVGTIQPEPSIFVAITLTLAATAFGASVVPSRQAASVDPVQTLRTD